jgi:hypothetical protein
MRICFKVVWMLLAASLLAEPLLTDFMLRKTSHLSRSCYLEDRLMSAFGPKQT